MLLLLSLSAAAETNWFQQAVWDDGLAEVCLYEGVERKYGTLRPTEVDLITVREFMDPVRRVKTAPAEGKQTLAVMKQNLTRRTRTGVYEYVQAASVFHHRESGALLKLNAVSTEWCGNSSALVSLDAPGQADLRIHSYMDDMGRQEETLALEEGIWFYEAIIPRLRSEGHSLKVGRAFRCQVSLMTNRPAWEVVDGTVLSREAVQVQTDSGRTAAIRIVLRLDTRTETFVIERDGTRRLLEWSADDGGALRLRRSMWIDYWNKNRAGDETLLH